MLSLCMIVKNEEHNLLRCLNSVKNLVDEMIIVDTGSTDGTVEIAKSFGAEVHHFEWTGSFSDARNFSMKRAKGDWILIMDADDEMYPYEPSEIRALIDDTDADAYFFETISYLGEKPGNDIFKNMNIRLLRNRRGYFFSGAIHEQIYSNIIAINPQAKIVNKDMIVYHYGYLKKSIIAGNKRSRNIGLLEKELEKNPESNYSLYNLGSEYCAQDEAEKALVLFEKVYENFNPDEGYSTHLILKMACCYIDLCRYEEAIRLCDEGLAYYPDFTDLIYMKGLAYDAWGKKALALRCFEKCCEKGEAPGYLNVIIGAGACLPCFMLGSIYYEWEEYELAEEILTGAFTQSRRDETLEMLIKTWCAMKLEDKELTGRLNSLGLLSQEHSRMIIEILTEEKRFAAALILIGKYGADYGEDAFAACCRGCCMLCRGEYEEAIICLSGVEKGCEYHIRAAALQALCYLSLKQFTLAEALFEEQKEAKGAEPLKVCCLLCTLLKGEEPWMLCDDQAQAEAYTGFIFEALRILLVTKQLQSFEKALRLLECVRDNTVFLRLAKLYYAEKCFGLAHAALTRSIRVFDMIDTEGAKILLNLKYMGL